MPAVCLSEGFPTEAEPSGATGGLESGEGECCLFQNRFLVYLKRNTHGKEDPCYLTMISSTEHCAVAELQMTAL